MKRGSPSQRAFFLSVVGLAAALACFFAPLIFAGRVLFYDDIYDYFHWHVFPRLMAQHGRFLFWDPREFAGLPALGDIQKELLYPLALPFYLMDTAYAHTVFTLTHFAVCGLGTYHLARVLGMGRAGAVTSALAFPLGSFVVFHLTMTPLLAATAWLPWVLAASWRLAREPGPRAVAAAALAWAMECLAGFPQLILFCLGAVAGLPVLGGLLGGRRAAARGGAALVLALGLGCALASVQLLATADMTDETPRGHAMTYAFASTYSLEPAALWTLVSPFALGDPPPRADLGERRGPLWSPWPNAAGGVGYRGPWSLAEMCAYPGLVTWMLAAAAFASKRRRLRAGLLTVAAGALLLALGPWGGLHRLLFSLAPYFGKFRAPCRFLVFTQLALALLAGLGMEALSGGSAARAARWALGVGAVLLAARCAAPAPAGAQAVLLAVPLACLVLAGIGVAGMAGGRRVPGLGMILLGLYADLAFAGQGYVRTVPIAATHASPVAVERLPADRSAFRLLAGTAPAIPGTVVARTEALGIQNIQGINPLPLTRYVQYLYFVAAGRFPRSEREMETQLAIRNYLFMIPLRDAASPLISLLGGRYALGPPAQPGGALRLYENPRALPRFWVAPRAEVEADGERALARVQSGAVDPRQVIVLAAASPSEAAAGGETGTVSVERDDGDRMDLAVTAPQGGYLGTGLIYEKSWRAAIDGAPAPVLRAFHALLAVPIPPGTHHVALTYRPRTLRLGILLTALGAAAILVLQKMGTDTIY